MPSKPHGLRPTLLATFIAGFSVLSMSAWATPEKAASYYEDALKRFEAGDLDSASIQLKNSLQQDKKMLAAHLLLGKVLLAKGEYAAAEVALAEAQKQGVSRSEVLVSQGQLYLITGERKKLLDEIQVTGMPSAIHADILTMRGSAYAGLGNVAQASKAFAEARALKPGLAAPWMAEAPLLMRQGEGEKARAAATKAVELEPRNAAAWYTLGSILLGLKDSKGALAAHEKALALNEKQVDSRVARASLLLMLGREKEAEKDIDLLDGWGVMDPRASYVRGVLAAQRGDANAARAAFTKAAELVDAQKPASLAGNDPVLMAGALAHKALNNNEKAKAYLDTLLTLNPKHFSAQLLLGGILIDSKDYSRASTLLEGAQRVAPDDPQVLMLLGSLQMARKQYLRASEFFEKAAKSSATPEAKRELAFSQLGLGQTRLGVSNLESVFAANPADARAGIQLAMSLINQGKSNQALQTALSLTKADPGNLTMQNFLGNIQGRVGDKKAARQTFQQILVKDANFKPAAVNLSWLDMEEQRYDEARTRLKLWLNREKKDPDLLFQLGVLEVRAGRLAEAQELLQSANELQRNDPRPGLTLIELFLSQQQADKAIATGKTLNAKLPNRPPVVLALGRAYLAAGDKASARTLFQDAGRLADFDANQQVHIGRLQILAGNLEGAAYSSQKALQADPNDLQALVFQVEIEAQKGDQAKLDAALKALNTKHAGSTAALLANGNVAMLRRQFPAAQAAYRQVLDKAPSSNHAMLLARAFMAAGEADKALTLIESQAKKSPQDAGLLRASAELQVNMGKNEAAAKSFVQLLSLSPKDVGAMSSYAILLQRMGDAKALSTAEQALQLAPSSAEAADTLGWVLALQSKYDLALRHLREARLRDPSNGNIRFHLAYALSKSGRKPEAKEELSAALNASSRPGDSKELSALKLELGL
ncbi:XrtA/PEP-CTERM system TPR-repeat protein PrsT [Paucibacter sp. Y2R2-4]|uniref:XrtA/PEP-CTERM system TPR-repeat protein PrsT n=1 Tax=Paucibacter sp. Y2R2-4 TaxID=2893553 RepID=UPI0021E413F7|nr:XrtA/PEP-CTERM system TPR-repeat protein PrsT [Paucibacter sp. Y2R2-4]MCV2348826.1 PEP-CTERM system TPR-repeat protein PrsT [Paucibacter sp. Y2R2-4]